MTRSERGHVVLVDFGFSEGVGSNKRPALVVSPDAYYQSRQEIIVAAMTSNVSRELAGDTTLKHWREAGLLFPSMATGILRTIKARLIIRALGALSPHDLERVERNLRLILSL